MLHDHVATRHIDPLSRRFLRVTASATAVLVAAGLAVTVPASSAVAGSGATAAGTGAPRITRVTLVTGDVAIVTTRKGARRTVALEPRLDGTLPQAAITDTGDHLYVVPRTAVPLLAAKRLDLDLFDVAGLMRAHYDDKATSRLPVIVDYGTGAVAARESQATDPIAAHRSVTVPKLGVAAFEVTKRHARAFWKDVTAGGGTSGAPSRLADGATRIDLDGRVSVDLEHSVPQIHAPEAWARGDDGTGVKVAVLDTGYDATHPDLAGRVIDSKNFTEDPSVVDGQGHGTHVAATIAGSGAASGGLRKGVAPGASLLIGKVLSSQGFGEDSMVLAGMQWAVDQHADVISMSLGGGVSDGTDPLSRAVNELSASSDSLFVIAAGNMGGDGPSTVASPGAADAALTVGAVDDSDAMAYFSSRGPRLGNGGLKPEVVAPGVDITAAQAAGTDLGGEDGDPLYTSISGTSMATPHVAGLAAIVKQAHPTWDGEQLKDAITESTVPVANATGFDAGTGRVDAIRALDQDVFTDHASLPLGFYAWPHNDVAPTHTPLTYTNTADTPVTLALDVAGEDGSDDPGHAISLGAASVTVPAHGTATADVVLDPTIAAPGAYPDVVTATPDDGGVPVRTEVGYVLEPELYNVTVVVRPRHGERASHQVALSGMDSNSFDMKTLEEGTGEQQVTFRVPPGRYGTGDLSFGVAADGGQDGVLTLQPNVDVTKDTTVVLDGSTTKRFNYDVDRPVVSDGTILNATWASGPGFIGFTLYGFADRVYASPTPSTADGRATADLAWVLSQPELEVLPKRGGTVAMRSVAAAGHLPWETTVPELAGRHRIVDAGDVSALTPSRVRGAVALVRGNCSDLGTTAAALAKAGAIGMVATAAPGASCAGTLEAAPAIPTFQVRPFDVGRLQVGGVATFRSHRGPAYMYDLEDGWDDQVPAGATLRGTGKSVAALVENYRSLGGTSQHDDLGMLAEMVGWLPGRDSAAFGLVHRVPAPWTVTHYVTAKAEWERTVHAVSATTGQDFGMLTTSRRLYAGGSTHRDTWFGGPLGSRVSPYMTSYGWDGGPNRQGDEMFLAQPPITDAAGHMGSILYLDEYYGALYADGELLTEGDEPLRLNQLVPAGKHRFRVVQNYWRNNPFWQRSTRVETDWGFTSDTTPQGGHEVLPLLSLNYEMALSSMNTAPANRSYAFGISFAMPERVTAARLAKHTIEVSTDRGATWHQVAENRCTVDQKPATGAVTSCLTRVLNPKHGTVSLRVSATDRSGRSVRQTIIDAYAVS
jgi:hypothetical protein